jgi:hypothetical protein
MRCFGPVGQMSKKLTSFTNIENAEGGNRQILTEQWWILKLARGKAYFKHLQGGGGITWKKAHWAGDEFCMGSGEILKPRDSKIAI